MFAAEICRRLVFRKSDRLLKSARSRSEARTPRARTHRPGRGIACPSSSDREVGVASSEAPYRRAWRFLAAIAAANYPPRGQSHMRKAQHGHSTHANASGDGGPLNLIPQPKART